MTIICPHCGYGEGHSGRRQGRRNRATRPYSGSDFETMGRTPDGTSTLRCPNCREIIETEDL